MGGKLTEARFQMRPDDYEQEQAELREKIDILEDEIQQQEDQTENVDKFIRQAKKYLHLEKLTPAVVNDLVKAVYVHAPDNSSGHRVQDVEISYNYIGILPATLLYNLKNGKRNDRNHAVSRKQLLNCFIGPPLPVRFFFWEKSGSTDLKI